jgi:signal transduction histidine kinase
LSHVDLAQVDQVELVVGKQTKRRLTSALFHTLALAALMLALGAIACISHMPHEGIGAEADEVVSQLSDDEIGTTECGLHLPTCSMAGAKMPQIQRAWISANDGILLLLTALLLLAALALGTARRRNARAARELDTRQRQLESMERLAGNLGQDLQRLLAQMDASIRKLHVEPERTRSHTFAVIAGALERGKALSHDLFFLGRPPYLVPRVFDVCDWLMETKESWLRSPTNNVAIELHLPNAPRSVRVNPTEFETAIFGLILNVKDIVPDGGTISVTVDISSPSTVPTPVAASGELIAISITNTGTNVAIPSDRSLNVMPGGTASTMPELDYVRKFAEESGGNFMISDDGAGCVSFILYIPRYTETIESQSQGRN